MLVTDAVYGPTRRFCNNHLTRLGIEVTYYDPLARRRDRARVPPEHAHRVHRVAGIADVRRAGHSGDRRRRARARRARRHRQLVGDAVRLSRRSTTASTCRCTRRPSTSAAIRTCCSGSSSANEATFPALHRLWTDMGVTASTDDCFLGLRGLAHAAAAPRAAVRRARSTIARWLRARPEVREVIYPALPGSRGHELWKRDFIGASGLFARRAAAGRQGAHRRDARRHAPLRHGLELGRLREPASSRSIRSARRPRRNGTPADRACASRSASRIRTI